MRFGLTYDLRSDYLAEGFSEQEVAEFDRESTIEAIDSSLRSLGHDTDRVGHIRALTQRLGAGDRWDAVFNIAEGLHGIGREAQVPALLDAHGIGYTFSDPLVLSVTLHKAMTKRIVRDLGVPTPDFAAVERAADADAVDLPFPLFVKPVAGGSSQGVFATSRVTNRRELADACASVIETFAQPALVETFLPGREFTVGVVGTGDGAEAVGAMEIHYLRGSDEGVYTYRNKEDCESLIRYELAHDPAADEAKALALAVWRGLGCRDAGRVDVRLDARGIANFIEVNPLPGMHPEHSDLPILCNLAGIGYRDLIARIIDRCVHNAPPPSPTGEVSRAKRVTEGALPVPIAAQR